VNLLDVLDALRPFLILAALAWIGLVAAGIV
jgi:hypothetical protein